MAKKPTDDSFKAEALFIDTKPTAYNTKFKLSALYQVAKTINEEGIPLLLFHNTRSMPVGAWYEADVQAEELITKFFVPKEIKEYKDIKTRIEAKILDKVSIGFTAKVHECSICGFDIHDYQNCDHVPGRAYEVPLQDASVSKEVTCYVLLDEVRAAEGSLVYSGAVPRAKIFESDTSSKEEFFIKNNLNFADNALEVVHDGKFLYNNNEQINTKESEMTQEEYDTLLAEKEALKSKYTDAREQVLTLKETNMDLAAKAEKAAAYSASADKHKNKTKQAKEAYEALLTSFKETVAGLAAPFKDSYEAPSKPEDLLADLKKFIELSKELPSGQQSTTADEATYSGPADEVYKV